jgi:hypothetical protein
MRHGCEIVYDNQTLDPELRFQFRAGNGPGTVGELSVSPSAGPAAAITAHFGLPAARAASASALPRSGKSSFEKVCRLRKVPVAPAVAIRVLVPPMSAIKYDAELDKSAPFMHFPEAGRGHQSAQHCLTEVILERWVRQEWYAHRGTGCISNDAIRLKR